MTDEEIMKALCPFMGWEYKNILGPCGEKDGRLYMPLEDGSHRDLVVERMREKGWSWRIGSLNHLTWCQFFRADTGAFDYTDKDIGHAVCLAALAAVKEEA